MGVPILTPMQRAGFTHKECTGVLCSHLQATCSNQWQAGGCTDLHRSPTHPKVYICIQSGMHLEIHAGLCSHPLIIDFNMLMTTCFMEHEQLMHGWMDRYTSVNEALRNVVVVPSAQACLVVFPIIVWMQATASMGAICSIIIWWLIYTYWERNW